MTSLCIAKSKDGNITVKMKEKYGQVKTYKDLSTIMTYNKCFYLISKKGTRAVLPVSNWAISNLDNPKPDEN